MKLPKILSVITVFIILLAFTVTPQISQIDQASAVTIDELKKKQDEINKKINDLNQQIKNDINTQATLNEQIKSYDNLISRIGLEVEQKQNALEITKATVNDLNKQRDDLELTIQSLKDKIDELKARADQNTLTMFKLDRQSTVSLVATKSIKEMFVSKAMENNARNQAKAVYDELDDSKQTLEVKQSEVAGTIKAQQDLLKQMEAEQQQLLDSQNGLAQTKASKNSEIAALQRNVTSKIDTKTELGKQAAQIQAQIAQFQINVGGSRPPSGTRVNKGDVIGAEGNTGYVCEYDASKGYTKDICAGFGYGWYLASSTPCAGAHLHFMYERGGAIVNPLTYINNGTIGTPLSYYRINQGFGVNPQVYGPNGHPAVDLHQYCGAPVLAAQDGIITYGVDQYGGKYAVVFGDDNTKTKYWHLK